jgi:RNA polymerase sigma-70 factor (ECF subfamily)
VRKERPDAPPDVEGPVEDEELVSRTAAGDIAAFTELYDRYARRIHTWCAHVLGAGRAEDAMQEIFLRLWQHAGQFDRERGTFTTWFTAIARHYLVHMLRRDSMLRRVAMATELAVVLEHGSALTPGPEETLAQREDGAALAGAMKLLPDEQRQVLVLAYFGGLSQSQIAEDLALPLGTVKKRIRLGMGKLRDALAPQASSQQPPGAGRAAR